MKRKFKRKKKAEQKGSTSARLKWWDTESAEPETAERLAIGDGPFLQLNVSHGTRTIYTCSFSFILLRKRQRFMSCTARISL